MKLFEVSEVVEATIDQVWDVWIDVPAWSSWDPHEEDSRLDADFVVGAQGWAKPKGAPAGPFTLVGVEPRAEWVSRSPLPGGGLTFTHRVERADSGTRITLRSEVRGPLTLLLKLVWAKKMAADAPLTLRALGAEANRRVATVG